MKSEIKNLLKEPWVDISFNKPSKKEEIESLNKYCHYSKENVLSELDTYSNDNIKIFFSA